jgi:hypothetical protein
VENKRRRKPGRPKGTGTTGTGTLIAGRYHPEFIDLLDEWRSEQEIQPARATAVRRLAEIGLESLGLRRRPRRRK